MERASDDPSVSTSHLQFIAAAAVVLLATGPFVNKAMHIDDPADLQYVRQILQDPGDPYGFLLDWDEGPRPAIDNYHPPLKYYYHALLLRIVPFSEASLHVSYVPLVAAIAWAILSLAKRFKCPPLALLVVWLLGPGYLPGQNAMLDVPVLALSLVATAIFIRGVDQDRMALVCTAGTLLGAALLTKYSALVYVVVWAVYAFSHGKARHWIALSVPAVIFGVWCIWSFVQYDVVHALVLFQGLTGRGPGHSFAERILPMITFLGGVMPGALLWRTSGSRPHRAIVVAVPLGAALLLVLAPPRRQMTTEFTALDSVNLVWWFLLVVVGLRAIGSALFEPLRLVRQAGAQAPETRDTLFLASWFWITLALGSFASPFLAVRRVLEASLPAWMLLMRVCRKPAPSPDDRTGTMWLAVASNTALGLLVACADYELAGVYRRYAAELAENVGSHSTRVRCFGYWGWFHYYRANHLPTYSVGDMPPVGSLVVIPDEAAKPARIPPSLGHRLHEKYKRYVAGRIPVRVMHYQSGAGFYSSSWGPLPYTWSRLPVEVFHFYEVAEPAE